MSNHSSINILRSKEYYSNYLFNIPTDVYLINIYLIIVENPEYKILSRNIVTKKTPFVFHQHPTLVKIEETTK